MSLPRISPSWLVTVVVLVLASSTGAYAAGLAANSVGTKHLKNNAVVSTKVKDGSLRRTDFRPGTLLRGPTGPAGPRGPQGSPGPQGPVGPSGTVNSWMHVGHDGSVYESHGAPGAVVRDAPGIYCIGAPFGNSQAMGYLVTTNYGYAYARSGWTIGCPSADMLGVAIYHNGQPVDARFTIARLW